MKSKTFVSHLNHMSDSAFSLLKTGFMSTCLMLVSALFLRLFASGHHGNALQAYHIAWALFSNASLVFLLSGLGAAIIEERNRK